MNNTENLTIETVLYEQDVWQIRWIPPLDDSDLSSCAIGYKSTQAGFHYSDIETIDSEDEKWDFVNYYKHRLKQFTTQQEFSIKLFNYLKDPRRKLQNIDISHHDLFYREVPIPLFREDFPNKAAIMMALDTKIRTVGTPFSVSVWDDWLNRFKKHTEGKTEQ